MPVRGYHIYFKGKEVTFLYPRLSKNKQIRAEGRSFHHGRFITKLREAASRESRLTMIEGTVETFITDDSKDTWIRGVKYYYGGQPHTVVGIMQERIVLCFDINSLQNADLTIIADGANSNLRRQLRNEKPLAKSSFWGLELHGVNLPVKGCAHGVIGNGFPVLLYPLDGRSTRILIDIPKDIQKACAEKDGIPGYIKASVVPRLPECVQAAVLVALKSGGLRSMPNYWLPAKNTMYMGAMLLGDAGNIRHPLTGGGMTVALKDVITLRRVFQPESVRLDDQKAVLRAMCTFQEKPTV